MARHDAGALLGAGAEAPPGRRRPAGLRAVSKLTPAECRRLIAPGGVGRIAFGTGSGPLVLPVNFAVLAGTVVVRTAEGTVIDGHAGEQAALEVDHIDEALCQGWSVLVRGLAHRVAHPAERAACRRTPRSGRGRAASARSTCGSCPARSPAAASRSAENGPAPVMRPSP